MYSLSLQRGISDIGLGKIIYHRSKCIDASVQIISVFFAIIRLCIYSYFQPHPYSTDLVRIILKLKMVNDRINVPL